LIIANGSYPSSFKIKKTPVPINAKQTIKYNAPKPIKILSARFDPKDAERKNDFHSSLIKCLNIRYWFWFFISSKIPLFVTAFSNFLSLINQRYFLPLSKIILHVIIL
jgi:hypothetical protein